MQLARGITKPCQNQNLRHHRPGNLFSSSRKSPFQKINQSHLPAQLQPDPRTTKRPLPFDGDALQINFYPLRFNVTEQSALRNSDRTCGLLVNAQTPCRIQLTEVGHHALPRAPRRAIAFDQRPVAVTLAILLAIATTQVHASILQIPTSLSRGLVFTTNAFTDLHERASETQTANTNVREFSGLDYFETVLKKFSNHLELRKLGYDRAKAVGFFNDAIFVCRHFPES